jgi:hypothetical protein
MKIMIIGTALLLCALPIFAEQETLVQGKFEHGGFGAPVVKFTMIDNNFGIIVGARGAWLINHSFSIGVAGYRHVYGDMMSGNMYYGRSKMYMGYGGVTFEYIFFPDKVVHFSLSSLLGAGANWAHQNGMMNGYGHGHGMNMNMSFIAEPEIDMIVNIAPFARFVVGAGYRFVAGGGRRGITPLDMWGLTGTVAFQLGAF